MRFVFGLLAAGLALAAGAEPVYKCEKDGKFVYTDQPCAPDAQPHALPSAIVVKPSGKSERELAKQHDARIRRDRAQRDKSDAAWVKEHESRKDREARVREAIIEHRAIKGMSADEVRQALGEPDKVSRSESYGSDKETWTYREDGATRSVNFKNGEVSSIGARKDRNGKR
jgi:hypothetical protein